MPAVRKRQLRLSGTSIDFDAPQSVKRAHTTRGIPAGESSTASDIEIENIELKKLAADAFAFIEKKELVSQAAASIKKAMLARPNRVGLETQAVSIVSGRTLTTSDDISKRAISLFNEIRTTMLTSVESRRFEIAYKLVMDPEHLSYTYPSSHDERDGDPIADELLIELAKERFAAGER